MAFLFTLVFGFAQAYGQAPNSTVYLPRAAPIYARPNAEARLLLMAAAGDKVTVQQRGKLYSRIVYKRAGKNRVGYILSEDLVEKAIAYSRGDFGYGGGGLISYLQHAGKAFETEDQVNYATEGFTSLSFFPSLVLQYRARDFWRLLFTYRLTDYESSAMTDVPGAAPRDLSLKHKMFSFTLQKMWNPFRRPNFYYGVGIEVSRASSADLVLGSNKMSVASEDLPTYFGGHAAAGWQFDLNRAWSAFAEGRAVGFLNQTPMIMGAELAAGLIYWP